MRETYTRIAPGIFKVIRRGKFVGYRAVVWIVDRSQPRGGRLLPKRFKKDATLRAMKDWRLDERRLAKLTPSQPTSLEPTADGFAGDAARYLEAVRAMPTFKDRARDIGQWIAIFGDTPRADITAAQIRHWRDRWLTVGPKRVLRKPKKTEKARWVELEQPLWDPLESTCRHASLSIL